MKTLHTKDLLILTKEDDSMDVRIHKRNNRVKQFLYDDQHRKVFEYDSKYRYSITNTYDEKNKLKISEPNCPKTSNCYIKTVYNYSNPNTIVVTEYYLLGHKIIYFILDYNGRIIFRRFCRYNANNEMTFLSPVDYYEYDDNNLKATLNGKPINYCILDDFGRLSLVKRTNGVELIYKYNDFFKFAKCFKDDQQIRIPYKFRKKPFWIDISEFET